MVSSVSRDPNVTHKIMSSIKSKNTKPEVLLRKALWERGLRYRVNYKKVLGKPDVVFTRAKIAVFCDGDFWHGHNWAIRGLASFEEELKTYSDYWRNKIINNVERDKRITVELEKDGWTVLRYWESDILANPSDCADRIQSVYKSILNSN